MFGVSSWEMMFLAVIALLLFGKNLPQVARSLGKGMMEFKKGLAGIDEEIYAASNRPVSTPQSRPLPSEEREEATAPKFEPPKYEPTPVNPDQPA
ncbi:MAG TPA: twin-arginine translocase TatA/TatE family subunit [Planctomycetaceae bacterium]|nr:twin-arginine translocase TatA/TatE family subunit [Planctomycetaceae bacterium]